MSYNSFQIVEEMVDCCHWDERNGTLVIHQQRTIYKIVDPITKLVLGFKRSIQQAKRTIDLHAKQWELARK